MTQIKKRNPIRELSSSIVNKIAAGEVIERPASVVKELLENAVDSGATKIEVSLEQGGTELIRVTDNGSGIASDQLELAVTSHATSKITDADDLFRVASFGFRGEALASIAEVSQTLIRSRTPDQESGFELRVNGGNREPIQPCGAPVGTTIEVRQLFYNTPVRRKFLRTPQTEKGHISEAFTRVALAHPEIQMTLINNSKTLQQLPATDNWHERIGAFFGPEIAEALIPVASEHQGVQLSGFVVNPTVTRGNNRMQYLFLNHRYIKDRSLQHALAESYRGLIMSNRYPICFLRIDMPFDMVDVNVHPGKLEVRFQNGGQIYSQLLSMVRNKFLSTDLTAHAQLSRRETETTTQTLAKPETENQDKIDFSYQRPSMDWTAPRQPNFEPSHTVESASTSPLPRSSEFGQETEREAPWYRQDGPQAAPVKSAAVQVHNTYLVTENEDGMVVIDQHALHERIIYEQLREKVLAGKLETQKLLVPEPVPLPPAEAAAVLEHSELLAKIGMVVEPFGGDTILVSAYPAMLANHNPAEMLRGVVDQLMAQATGIDQRDLVDELLHMISCKAAIKAGDKLSPEEINELIEHRQLCQDAHHCPHGRPTALVFSRQELDRRFKRI